VSFSTTTTKSTTTFWPEPTPYDWNEDFNEEKPHKKDKKKKKKNKKKKKKNKKKNKKNRNKNREIDHTYIEPDYGTIGMLRPSKIIGLEDVIKLMFVLW
jgi:hypothetical protein